MSSSALPATPHASPKDPTIAEERRFKNRYLTRAVRLLGEGTFGWVHQAYDIQTGVFVALKHMKNKEHAPRLNGVPAEWMREISILKQLQHPNVVRLQDVYYQRGALILVFELMARDLKEYMEAQPCGLTPADVVHFLHQLCDGIKCCHSHAVMHRDLKPQNLLVDDQLCLKIADFGLARTFAMPLADYTPDVVTPWYRAPELLLGSIKYTTAVDIWSIGCIHAEMATGAPPFQEVSTIDVVIKMFKILGTPTETTWPGVSQLPAFTKAFPPYPRMGWANVPKILAQIGHEGIDLLQQFTHYHPRSRTSAKKALQHHYLANFVRFTI